MWPEMRVAGATGFRFEAFLPLNFLLMSIETETEAQLRPLEQATFQNSFVEEMKGEASMNKNPRQVPGYHYSRVDPTPVADPHLLAWSDDMGRYLGLTRPPERGPAIDMLAGNRVAETMKPFAARYGGHQFGNWAGQLGDGRAMSLGELTAAPRHTRAVPMDALCCALRCGSFCAARPCITWAYRLLGH
jgi:hypothetical protein